MNRWKLKFTNFKHNYKLGLALEIKSSPKERGKQINQRNIADDTVICFTEVRFLQTYSPLMWSQRSGLFQPFPSLKRSLGPSELFFSITWNTKFPQGPPQDWCLLPQLQVSLIAMKNQERRKQSKRKSSKEHKQISFTSH